MYVPLRSMDNKLSIDRTGCDVICLRFAHVSIVDRQIFAQKPGKTGELGPLASERSQFTFPYSRVALNGSLTLRGWSTTVDVREDLTP